MIYLALSIVKQIIDIHGWYLRAQIENDRLYILLRLQDLKKGVEKPMNVILYNCYGD